MRYRFFRSRDSSVTARGGKRYAMSIDAGLGAETLRDRRWIRVTVLRGRAQPPVTEARRESHPKFATLVI